MAKTKTLSRVDALSLLADLDTAIENIQGHVGNDYSETLEHLKDRREHFAKKLGIK